MGQDKNISKIQVLDLRDALHQLIENIPKVSNQFYNSGYMVYGDSLKKAESEIIKAWRNCNNVLETHDFNNEER